MCIFAVYSPVTEQDCPQHRHPSWVEALLRIPKRCCNLDTFRTSGRRLQAGFDADVTDVSTVTVVTTVTAMTAVTRHELQNVTWDSLYRSPQIGTEKIIKHHS